MAKIELELEIYDNWLVEENMVDLEWYELYMKSFYWSLASIFYIKI